MAVEQQPRIKEFPVLESLTLLNPEGRFYVQRLMDLCNTRQTIDSGSYPLLAYSSEEGGAVPIFPGKPEKGLRFGILRSIYGVNNMLNQLGYTQVANDVLAFDKARQPK